MGDTPTWTGGTPSPIQGWGTPKARWGTPHLRLDGVPSLQGWMDGVPPSKTGWYYPPSKVGCGYPPFNDGGTPLSRDEGTPPPSRDSGIPFKVPTALPPAKDLLHDGRYASCVHVGVLSCSIFFSLSAFTFLVLFQMGICYCYFLRKLCRKFFALLHFGSPVPKEFEDSFC